MPEGPSLVIAKELMQPFTGKIVTAVSGNAKIPIKWIKGQRLLAVKTWGKHLLLSFKSDTIRIHFLLFGSYLINSRKKAKTRLRLSFKSGEINFYASAIKLLEEDPDDVYDWSADVMNKNWDSRKARRKLKQAPETEVADALLEQEIFAGVGNIIKNEVLFRIRVHPESLLGKLPKTKLTALIREAKVYSFEFLEWKKANELKKHWKAHHQKTCERCNISLVKKVTGRTKRQSYFCSNCQILYR